MTCTGISCNQGRAECRDGCNKLHTANSDGSDPDMPITMIEKPYAWIWQSLRDAIVLASLAGLLGVLAWMIFGAMK